MALLATQPCTVVRISESEAIRVDSLEIDALHREVELNYSRSRHPCVQDVEQRRLVVLLGDPIQLVEKAGNPRVRATSTFISKANWQLLITSTSR